ncbi:MAG: pyrroline-5-carboxylate reductase [Oscillospiraceae bacterium]|nr:pyrroline-5-carboxylate reductase [Oscillospiraceae bacterium]MDD4547032.1 pyrroline-5-carboxylate reductase [Oscillospiraceae bacterium]
MKIGFIGAGNMGGAILHGLISGGFRGGDILVYDKDSAKLMQVFEDCGIVIASDEEEVVKQADTVILAVKPQALSSVLPRLAPTLCRRSPLVISIAAGKTLAWVSRLIGDDLPIARVMPNIAAKVGEGMSAFCCNEYADDSHKKTVRMIFEAVGEAIELDEHLFSAFTSIAGCSPAYTLMYIDTLAQAGVRYGIPKEVAHKIAAQSVLGTTRLWQESGEHPRFLADKVCSPGGTTIEGVCALQKNGFENAVLEAVKASYEKDEKL